MDWVSAIMLPVHKGNTVGKRRQREPSSPIPNQA